MKQIHNSKGMGKMKAQYVGDFEQWRKDFKFQTEIRVRFSETDMYGHVNNTVPFVYFEQARIDYLNSLGVFNAEKAESSILVVADLQCDFVKQVYFGETLHVMVKTASVGTSSMDLHYLALNENKEAVFVGRGTLVLLDAATGKGKALSEEEKQLLLGK